MRRWESILPQLTRFQQTYCSPAMPSLRLLVGSDRTWPVAEYDTRKPVGFPGKLRGVYLLFDQDERLQYVGAALWTFDKRVWAHDGDVDRRCIDIIPLADPWYVLTLALEFYLIQVLEPPRNIVYRDYGVVLDGDHEPIPRAPKLADG